MTDTNHGSDGERCWPKDVGDRPPTRTEAIVSVVSLAYLALLVLFGGMLL